MKTLANKPVQKFRCQNIEAAIWENKRKLDDKTEVSFKTVSLSRSYKKKGETKWNSDQMNLRRNDLQKVILVLQKAQENLLLTEDAKGDE